MRGRALCGGAGAVLGGVLVLHGLVLAGEVAQDGWTKLPYPNGARQLEEEYRAGQLVQRLAYYRGGQLKSEEHFKAGQALSRKTYSAEGALQLEEQYDYHGASVTMVRRGYDAAGQLQSQWTIKDGRAVRIQEFNEKGLLVRDETTSDNEADLYRDQYGQPAKPDAGPGRQP